MRLIDRNFQYLRIYGGQLNQIKSLVAFPTIFTDNIQK